MSKEKLSKIDGFVIGFKMDDDDWVAYFKDMPQISGIGDTQAQAVEELKIAWEAVKESHRKHGEAVPEPKKRGGR